MRNCLRNHHDLDQEGIFKHWVKEVTLAGGARTGLMSGVQICWMTTCLAPWQRPNIVSHRYAWYCHP